MFTSMETSKLDVLIPLAIAAAAGFLFARSTRRKDTDLVFQGDRIQSVDSSCFPCSLDSSSPETHDHELEEEISALRSSVKEMEIRYLEYGDRKGQELMVMELEKMIFVEITRSQIMEMGASSELQKQRFQDVFFEYQKTLGLLQLSRSRNRRRMKKMSRKIKERRELVMELHQQIEAAKAESSRAHEELCDKTEIIGKMEDEIQQLKDYLSAMMIEMADKASQSKKDEMAAETEELKHLRRSNAFLRDELTRKNLRKDEGLKFAEIGYFGSDDDQLDGHSGCLNLPTTISHGAAAHHSRRKKLIRRLKRWVEGSHHKEKHGYGGGDEMHMIQGRRSCSSV